MSRHIVKAVMALLDGITATPMLRWTSPNPPGADPLTTPSSDNWLAHRQLNSAAVFGLKGLSTAGVNPPQRRGRVGARGPDWQ